MAAELAIYEDLAKAGIPHYTGADSFVRNGAYATCGVNYTDLGAKTADLAYTAITDGMDAMEDYYLMDGGIITVNTDTAGRDAALTTPASTAWAPLSRSRPPRTKKPFPANELPFPRPAAGGIGLKGEFPHAHHHADRP